jgi:single-strand DNA-binding protein
MPDQSSPPADVATNTLTNPPTNPLTNMVVLRGVIAADPIERTLAAGGLVRQFDLRTELDTGTTSVPVVWHDPSASDVAASTAGTEVIVVGTVRRRFFRAGGVTQSRTEVVVDRLVPARRRATTRSLLASVAKRCGGVGA